MIELIFLVTDMQTLCVLTGHLVTQITIFWRVISKKYLSFIKNNGHCPHTLLKNWNKDYVNQLLLIMI